MLLDSGLPKLWWGHAILSATTVRNQCTTSTFRNKETLLCTFLNKEKDLKVLKPFGCTALVYIPLEKRTKIDVTGVRGTLVGVTEGLICYNVYCAATNRTITARCRICL